MGILYYSEYRMTRLLPLILVLIFTTYTKSQEKEKVILINGGWNGENVLNSTEILGGSLPCKVPNLPEIREFNKNVFTADGSVLVVGGDVSSVLVLDVGSDSWRVHSYLDVDRYKFNAVSMPDGVYVLGGSTGEEVLETSSYLPTGSFQWESGPSVPEGSSDACVVRISETNFRIIGGKPDTDRVSEYNIETGEWFEWPPLKQGRYGHSCAVLGDKIVFSGGFSDDGYYLKTTGILDFINGGEERSGGEMSVERIYFGMIGLEDKIVAFGGEYGSDYWDSVEEWDPSTEQWMVRDEGMEAARTYFGSVLVPSEALCPPERERLIN